jgi:hypothetical protein
VHFTAVRSNVWMGFVHAVHVILSASHPRECVRGKYLSFIAMSVGWISGTFEEISVIGDHSNKLCFRYFGTICASWPHDWMLLLLQKCDRNSGNIFWYHCFPKAFCNYHTYLCSCSGADGVRWVIAASDCHSWWSETQWVTQNIMITVILVGVFFLFGWD